MKIQIPFFCLFLLVLLTGAACKHTHYMPEKLPEKQLQWGTGGGFVGKESYYILLENGQVFQHEATMGDSLAEIQSVKRSVAKSMFKAADEAGIQTLDFKHPANMYSFLQYSGKRVVWGDKKFPVAEPVNQLYGKLNMLVNKDKMR
jgi:hypothetical protein